MSKKNTIILIYPRIDYEENYKFSWTPFSVLALAATLKRSGFNPVIIDQNRCSNEEVVKKIEVYVEDVMFIGFSVMTGGGQIGHALEMAQLIREREPSLTLVWGGPHVSAMPKQTAKHDLVDIAVVGQGDITICELASAFRNGTSLDLVNGICVKSTSGNVVQTDVRRLVSKNDLPGYPWDLVDINSYVQNDITINTRTLGYVSSQGCPYRCKFCYEYGTYNAWWSGFDAERIISDVKDLMVAHSLNGVKFYDADFFVKPSRIEQFCKGILSNGLDLKWAGSANPNDILRFERRSPNLLELIRGTGCTRLLMGMESGSNKILQLINKQTTVIDLKNVIRILTHHDFIGSFTFIVGFPGETFEDLQETLKLVDHIHHISAKHETRLHIFAPYPGTPLFDLSIKHGFVPHDSFEKWSTYNYYQPQTPWLDPKIVDTVKSYTKLH